MTLLVPGSAQRAGGNRTVGRVAMRIWGVVVLGAIVFVGWALVNRKAAISVVMTPGVTMASGVVTAVLGIAWGLLFLDTWRTARPVNMRPIHRLPFTLLVAALAVAVIWGGFAAGMRLTAAGSAVSRIFGGGGETDQKTGRYNILLLGGDAGDGREGMRPDSINVVSVDAATGRSVIVGVPRNLEGVRFPATSPMSKVYPDGFFCPTHECLINAINTDVEENHKDLYPKSKHPGLEATKEAVEETTGLDINYFVVMDLDGYRELIDALGGVRIDLNVQVPLYIEANGKISDSVGPGSNIHLDGTRALAFARAREDSTDYQRMARQRCLMNAMLTQLDPGTVLTKFEAIAKAGQGLVLTDIPPSESGNLVELAAKAKNLPVATVSLTPPLIDIAAPDWALMKRAVKDAVAASEAIDRPGKATTTRPPATQPPPSADGPTSNPPATSTTRGAQPTTTAAPTNPGTTSSGEVEEVCTASKR